MAQLVHVGIVVPDIAEAQEDLGRTLDLRFEETRNGSYQDWPLRMSNSLGSLPYLELLSSGPGSPWDAKDGARLDHLAWFTEDIDADIERLRKHGIEVEIDFRSVSRTAYFRHPVTGLRFELMDASMRPGLARRVGFEAD